MAGRLEMMGEEEATAAFFEGRITRQQMQQRLRQIGTERREAEIEEKLRGRRIIPMSFSKL